MTTATERAIGQLEGKLDALIRAVDASSADSKQYRARIYAEMEKVREASATSQREIADLTKQMEAAAPVISEINRWRERFTGMLMLIGALSAAFGGGVVILWKWVAAKLGMQ